MVSMKSPQLLELVLHLEDHDSLIRVSPYVIGGVSFSCGEEGEGILTRSTIFPVINLTLGIKLEGERNGISDNP